MKPVLKALHDGVNWSGIETDRSLPSRVEVKERVALYLHFTFIHVANVIYLTH
jgi:hypothetical protein